MTNKMSSSLAVLCSEVAIDGRLSFRFLSDISLDDTETTSALESQSLLWSISPFADRICIARQHRVVCLSKATSSSDSVFRSQFNLRLQDLIGISDSAQISAVLCAPLVPARSTNAAHVDFTCLIVGTTAGDVLFLSDSGHLLHYQRFHEGAVRQLKIRPTYRFESGMSHFETSCFMIAYGAGVVALVDSGSLYVQLQQCRADVARAIAAGSSGGGTLSSSSAMLRAQKLCIRNHPTAEHHEPCGRVKYTRLQLLQNASFLGGFTAIAKQSLPPFYCHATAGDGKLCGFSFVPENEINISLSDLAAVAADRLKSSVASGLSMASGLMGFLGVSKRGGGGRGGESAGSDSPRADRRLQVAQQPASNTELRYCLEGDDRRAPLSCLVSPQCRYLAVGDSLGRVLLFDVPSGHVLRIWKGYRHAHIAWIRSDNASCCLALYTPKRGILELWRVEPARRVFCRHVGSDLRLMHVGFSVLSARPSAGLAGTFDAFFIRQTAAGCAIIPIRLPAYLVDESCGNASDSAARDVHLLKELTQRCSSSTAEELFALIESIESEDVRCDALLYVCKAAGTDSTALSGQCAELSQRLRQNAEVVTTSPPIDSLSDYRRFIRLLDLMRALLDMYIELEQRRRTAASTSASTSGDVEKDELFLAQRLRLSAEELTELMQRVDAVSSDSASASSVAFTVTWPDFLALFDVDTYAAFGDEDYDDDEESTTPTCSLQLNDSDSNSNNSAATLINDALLCGSIDEQRLTKWLDDVHLPKSVWLVMLIRHWLRADAHSQPTIIDRRSLRRVCSLTQKWIGLCTAWQRRSIRSLLEQSRNIARALLIACVLRAAAAHEEDIARATESDKMMIDDDELSNEKRSSGLAPPAASSSSSDFVKVRPWNSVSSIMLQWNILCQRLDDILAFERLTRLAPVRSVESGSPTRTSSPVGSVTVAQLLQKSGGGLSEFVAQWIVESRAYSSSASLRVRPSEIRLALQKAAATRPPRSKSDEERSEEERAKNDDDDGEELDDMERDDAMMSRVELPLRRAHSVSSSNKADEETEFMRRLRQLAHEHFPLSLTADDLLANCAWESARRWARATTPESTSSSSTASSSSIDLLQAAIRYLELIENGALLHGMCSLIWHIFILERFRDGVQLLEKIGRAAKERLARRSCGMSDDELARFFFLVADFLALFQQANVSAEESLIPVPEVEQLWSNLPLDESDDLEDLDNSSIASKQKATLLELAIEQRQTDYLLLRHHAQLAICSCAIQQLQLAHGSRPLALFDERAQSAFFVPMHKQSLLLSIVDVPAELPVRRRQFVTRCLVAAIRRERDETLPRAAASSPSSGTWYHAMLELAKYWQVAATTTTTGGDSDVDFVRRQFVVELYSAGLDEAGAEHYAAVVERDVLASQLVLLVGRRVAYRVYHLPSARGVDAASASESARVAMIIGSMPTTLSTWLRSLDSSDLLEADAPLTSTLSLVRLVRNDMMSREQGELAMADDLVELLGSMIDQEERGKDVPF